jgi:hypothetical protein
MDDRKNLCYGNPRHRWWMEERKMHQFGRLKAKKQKKTAVQVMEKDVGAAHPSPLSL